MNAFSQPKVTVNSGCRIRTPVLKAAHRCAPARPGEDLTQHLSLHDLADAGRLEGDDGVGVLDAGKDLHLLVDEMPDIGVFIDVEFDQQIVVSSGGIDLGRNLGFRKRIGDGVGLAELALDLDKEGNHRCRLRKAPSWVQYSVQELAGNNTSR